MRIRGALTWRSSSRLQFWLTVVWLSISIAIALNPSEAKDRLSHIRPLHFVWHILLAGVAQILIGYRAQTRKQLLLATAAVFCFGCFLEWMQHFVFGNRFEWHDLFLNLLGIGVGLGVLWVPIGKPAEG